MPATLLLDLAAAHGVFTEFYDLHGHQHQANPDTLRALLAALGVDASTDRQIVNSLDSHTAKRTARLLSEEHIQQAGQIGAVPVRAACDWVLSTESGSQINEGRAETAVTLPALPVGYYLLTATAAGTPQQTRILARPAKAPDLNSRIGRARCWGMTGALYGLRSSRNGGLGNYGDLAQACCALGHQNAQFLGINPIHALGWAADDIISPYSPTHRGFFNIDHIAVDQNLGPTPAADLIDYPEYRKRHRAALEASYKAFVGSRDEAEFGRWQKSQGKALHDFAQFETLSQRFGHDFRLWPADLQSPGAAATRQAGPRAAFHAWLQWRANNQIDNAQRTARDAGMSLGLYLDLAVGPRPGGAEVWMNAKTIASGVTIGAPPDHLSPQGQSWTLAAHAPGPLSASFYAPVRAMLRTLMSRCGLLRIDHALGLLRSFWLPDDGSPGGYVSQPLDALLAVIAIEADISGCVIVGEDLGLVPVGFRDKLGGSGLYSYSVWQFETNHDGRLRNVETLLANSLACFGTHDTPTLQGFWYGEDIEWWQSVGWLGGDQINARHANRARQRQSLRAQCAIGPLANGSTIANAIQGKLAEAPSALLAVQLDDALGLTEAQNLPGTINEHPNWQRRLPLAVEDFAGAPEIQNVADLMPADRGSTPLTTKSTRPKRGSK